MTDIEVVLTDLGEIATRELARKHKPIGLEENREVSKLGGHTAKVAREELERNLGESVVSNDNAFPYSYVDEELLLDSKE